MKLFSYSILLILIVIVSPSLVGACADALRKKEKLPETWSELVNSPLFLEQWQSDATTGKKHFLFHYKTPPRRSLNRHDWWTSHPKSHFNFKSAPYRLWVIQLNQPLIGSGVEFDAYEYDPRYLIREIERISNDQNRPFNALISEPFEVFGAVELATLVHQVHFISGRLQGITENHDLRRYTFNHPNRNSIDLLPLFTDNEEIVDRVRNSLATLVTTNEFEKNALSIALETLGSHSLGEAILILAEEYGGTTTSYNHIINRYR